MAEKAFSMDAHWTLTDGGGMLLLPDRDPDCADAPAGLLTETASESASLSRLLEQGAAAWW
ncbi:MAG: hypothetical protein JO171_07700 [Paludibacterium sp.]|uniref:hypothetical protein n=1 Tax=Paludibacterium sp. TaxID=1917523 RepID=UPI0025DCA7CD|nr:hypothetical protein [Paludibacterium sp.]MBV8047018.1 hypothetical protein [Paludibacterium sp.]MBV8648182.1 hypothetical protein [Paludibacterium sp.]